MDNQKLNIRGYADMTDAKNIGNMGEILHSGYSIIDSADKISTEQLHSEFIQKTKNGAILKTQPLEVFNKYSLTQFKMFAHETGIYSFTTPELISFLQEEIGDMSAIEIGCGAGNIGRELGIPFTDAKVMNRFDVQLLYGMAHQPITKYPSDVEHLDAEKAVKKYKPSVVIGTWITHKYNKNRPECSGNMFGVDETQLLKKKCIQKYIIVGNEKVHDQKPIFKNCPTKFNFRKLKFPWIKSRASYPENNCIYIWERKKG